MLIKKIVSSKSTDKVYLEEKNQQSKSKLKSKQTPEQFFDELNVSPINKPIDSELFDSPWDFWGIEEKLKPITDENELKELAARFPKNEFNDDESKLNKNDQMLCQISWYKIDWINYYVFLVFFGVADFLAAVVLVFEGVVFFAFFWVSVFLVGVVLAVYFFERVVSWY